MGESSRSHKLLIAAALAALGAIANLFGLSLFLGVDMIFGSAVGLIALVWLGPGWALVVSAVAASTSYAIWHHPYVIVILVCETLAVAALRRRRRWILPVADASYWLFVGAPLIWLFYHHLLKFDATATTLVMLKQALNGIVNSLIATIVILFGSPNEAVPRAKPQPRGPLLSLSEHVFTAILSSITIASLLMLTLHGRNTLQTLHDHLERELHAVALGLNQDLNIWADQHRRLVSELANTAKELGLKSPALQNHTARLTRLTDDFHNMYVADENATAVAFSPPVNARGEKTIGQNFADRAYFKTLKETLQPTVSEVFIGRGGTFGPIVTLSAPILEGGKFQGYALGALNLSRLSRLLNDAVKDLKANATLVSPDGKIIASSHLGAEPLSDFNKLHPRMKQALVEGFHQNLSEEKIAPILAWSRSSFGWVQELKTFPGWKLVIEAPTAPYLAELYSESIRSLVAVLLLIVLAMAIAVFLSKRFSTPITTLAEETRDLPEKLTRASEPHWPQSSVSEIRVLVENFQTMSAALRARFEELRRSNELKDQFLANLSHELRTPLNVIHGYTELLLEEGWSKDAPGFLGVITRNVKHLSQLIDDLLDLSRVVAGKLAMNLQPLDLRENVESALLSARLNAEAKGLRLIGDLEPGPTPVLADPSRIHQIMANLLSNSIKFTPAGGEIRVSLKREGELAVLCVRDTGSGMSKEFLTHAFVRFVQEDGTSTRPHGGLGIGLSIVREIVLAHGGSITAESEGRDQGTAMTVRLPLVKRL